MTKKLTLGFSTCPNDTFIFDALVHNKVDTEGLQFDLILADVEELNQLALKGEIDITKLSYHAYAYVSEHYKLLNSGSALGNNNGPLLISKHKIYPDEVDNISVAIPGKLTTANLLLSISYPNLTNKKEYLFSDIEEVVLSGETDAGLIIHENRFTYQQKGLRKIIDLGEFWESKTQMPIPLGGIVVNRRLSGNLQKKIDLLLRKSLEYAYQNPNSSISFIKKYAQEMDESVMKQHIDLYVNNYSLDLGEKGRDAIKTLYKEAEVINNFPKLTDDIFVVTSKNANFCVAAKF